MIVNRKHLFVFFVALAFAGGAFFVYLALQQRSATPTHATVLPQPKSLPEFSLLDQEGREFNRASFRGQWSLVFFGFTHCPDICPATLQQLSLARAQVIGGGARSFPRIVLVSVDPERDTPEILGAYTKNFGDGVIGVTGSLDELIRLTSSIGIFFAKSDEGGDNYGVDHSAVVLLINPEAEFQALFSAPHKVGNFVADVPLIAGPD
jgi:protein SCO1/2